MDQEIDALVNTEVKLLLIASLFSVIVIIITIIVFVITIDFYFIIFLFFKKKG